MSSEDWRKVYAEQIEETWRKIHATANCMVCSVCGGGSTDICACAKKRWMDNLTIDDLLKYVSDNLVHEEKKQQQDKEEKIKMLSTKEGTMRMIVEEGDKYVPALNHYKYDYPPVAEVWCDNCDRAGIRGGIGMTVAGKKMDVCFKCAHTILEEPDLE